MAKKSSRRKHILADLRGSECEIVSLSAQHSELEIAILIKKNMLSKIAFATNDASFYLKNTSLSLKKDNQESIALSQNPVSSYSNKPY